MWSRGPFKPIRAGGIEISRPQLPRCLHSVGFHRPSAGGAIGGRSPLEKNKSRAGAGSYSRNGMP